MTPAAGHRRGVSLVGLLVTLVCMVVLFAIGMSALNQAMTGAGSALEGTVRSTKDKLHLYAMHQSLVAGARDFNGRFITPSIVNGTNDVTWDTTANLFSVMVMQNYIKPEQLVSGNEYSGWIEVDYDYDFRAYDPRQGVYWDASFEGDLERGSNVSYAHVPLFGDRFDDHWQSSLSSRFPILGNRGPRNGEDDPNSMTYGRNQQWGGHLVYGDGHIEFSTTFTPSGLSFRRDGQLVPDNIFALEDGEAGSDAILSFTQEMTEDGPVLQFD
jgi:hypothetical protein